MPTPIPNRGSDYELLLPPPVIHAVKFARHFFLFFLLPIAAVVIAALLAATLVISVRRSLFARIATPEGTEMTNRRIEIPRADGGERCMRSRGRGGGMRRRQGSTNAK